MIKQFKPNRICGECTACCEGWLSANIYGHLMYRGRKCHFLGKNCTIYENRPDNICKPFKCVWLADDDFSIPEWIKPSISKIIIVKKPWGNINSDGTPVNGKFYWQVTECGEKMSVEVLNWLISHCERNNIGVEYHIDGQRNIRGPNEFVEFMRNKIS